ncbi:MAG: hypothetical protein M3445_03910 [Actinomycetota bacterium]|nr:hypothetical protein [Actinomycetota bacterium]
MQSYSLFDPYPVSGTSIKSAAEDTRGRVASVTEVIAQLEQEHRQAVASVSGILEESVADAPTEAVTRATDVLQQAEYAAGCLELFGADIDMYNVESAYPRSISKLNAAYSAGLSDGFGAEYEAPADDATTEERQTANDDYTTAWNAGRRELMNALNAEKAQLDGELDLAATTVSTMLTQGPTQANVTSLWAAGVLPPYAPVLFPGVPLSGGDLPPDAQQELLQYLIDHPELLINTPSALASVIAGLPTDIRTDIEVERRMEQLRREGLLSGPNPGGRYEDWVRNTVEHGVSADTLIQIAGDHGITPSSFDVLDGMEMITDPDGKSFFLLDTDMSGDEARAAVLMTYILNAGTGYEGGDYSETPYSSDEVQRIVDRQDDNLWSYDEDIAFVHDNGGRLTTTPNGMLMGLGGDWKQDMLVFSGGTTYGDIFMVNLDDPEDAEEQLRAMVAGGTAMYDVDGEIVSGQLDLDRLLHHEEIHSQQYAERGLWSFIDEYLGESVDWVWTNPDDLNPFPVLGPVTRDGCGNALEEEAGLGDGGYQPCG